MWEVMQTATTHPLIEVMVCMCLSTEHLFTLGIYSRATFPSMDKSGQLLLS